MSGKGAAALLALLGALMAAPPVSGQGTLPSFEAPAAAAACAPPCGYIVPLLEIDLPTNVACGGSLGIVGPGGPCPPMLADQTSVVHEGMFRWSYEVTEEGWYPNDPQQDVQVAFGGSSSNPSYLAVVAEPTGFTLSTAVLADPSYLVTDDSDPTKPRVWYVYEQPIAVTVARDGGPTAAERTMAERGFVAVFLKASSSESSDRIRQSFGLEQFRFASDGPDGVATQGVEGAPLPWVAAPLALALAFRLRRR